MNFTIANLVYTGVGSSYCNSEPNWTHRLSMPGPSGWIETLYRIGAGMHYTSILTNIMTNLEDYATLEYQNAGTFTETITIDGATVACKFGARLTNLKLQTRTGVSPATLRNLATISRVNGLTIQNLIFTRRGIRVVDCNNVIINGSNKGYVTDQTFTN